MPDATTPETKPAVTMVDVMKFFEMKPAAFKAEWSKLTDKDKNDLKQWLEDLKASLEEQPAE